MSCTLQSATGLCAYTRKAFTLPGTSSHSKGSGQRWQNNPWALEEIERRLIEANKRGLWQPDEGLEELLEDSYLELEGILEESSGDGAGEFQGGAIDAQGIDELEAMQGHLKRMHQMLK